MVTRKPKKPFIYPFMDSLENVRTVVDSDYCKKVVFVPEDLKQRNRAQLDPRMVNLTYLIENNMLVSPKDFIKAFNISDPADLEAHNDIQNEKVLKYLEDHKDELKSLVSPVESKKESKS